MLLTLFSLAAADTAFERRLYAERVDASSFLWNDWNKFQENYHPNYVMDGDPATAWVEGAASDGVGEWLRVPLSGLDGATRARVRLRNGYQKSSTLYKANARAREVEVRLLPSGVTSTVSLTDAEGWQEIAVDQAEGRLEAIELRVKTVYPGAKYTDLCISDLEVYATATTRDNPAAEKAKLDRMLAWKADRVAAAKVFASSAKDPMSMASAYTLRVAKDGARLPEDMNCGNDPFCPSRLAVDALQVWRPELTRELAVARLAYATNFAGWTPVQVVPKDTRAIPPAEGLAAAQLWNCVWEPAVFVYEGDVSGSIELPIAGKLGLLRADQVGTFAVNNAPDLDKALSGAAPGCGAGAEKPLIQAWAKTREGDGPATLEALLLVACGEVEDREGMMRVAVPQLLVYGAQGELSLLVSSRYATAFTWKNGMISDAWRVAPWTEPVHATAGR